MPIALVDLPLEVLEQIVIFAAPLDVSSFARTCRATQSLVYGSSDHHLWRSLFLLQAFDDPRKCADLLGFPTVRNCSSGGEDVYDWKGQLQRRTRAATVMQNPRVCKPGEAIVVLRTLLDMASNIPVAVSPLYTDDPELSLNLAWIKSQDREARFLTSLNSLPARALPDSIEALTEISSDPGTQRDSAMGPVGLTPEENQLRAQLHVYYGVVEDDLEPSKIVRARAYVYDMRNYTRHNNYGPYRRDSSSYVNWVHVEAIQMVMASHLVSYDPITGRYTMSQSQMDLPFCQSFTGPSGIKDDWAGIQGHWKCAFCFCDHRDLMHYNTSQTPENTMHDSVIFEDPEFMEVFRVLDVEIRVTKIEPDDAQLERPRIHFVGSFGGQQTMVGVVSATSEGHIRWKFMSGEDHPVWSSEGVQIGSVQSMYGVLGTWTTVFHDEQDPVGPFWLNKIHDGSSSP